MREAYRDSKEQGPAAVTVAGPSALLMETEAARGRRWARRRRGERGQAVTEFALVLPLLAAVILIFVSFGKALYYYIELTHAANEGAREAAVNLPNGTTPLPGGDTSLVTYICGQFGTNSELYKGTGATQNTRVRISYPDSGAANPRGVGEPVKVEVITQYHWFPFMNLLPFTIDGSATMRIEQDTSGSTALDSNAPAGTSC